MIFQFQKKPRITARNKEEINKNCKKNREVKSRKSIIFRLLSLYFLVHSPKTKLPQAKSLRQSN